jgi:hypothetical protein
MASKIQMDELVVWNGLIMMYNVIVFIVSPKEIRKADKKEIKQYYSSGRA